VAAEFVGKQHSAVSIQHSANAGFKAIQSPSATEG